MNSSRRGFLGMMVGGIAVAAAAHFPFRVYSFPTAPKIELWPDYTPFSEFKLAKEIESYYTKDWIDILKRQMPFEEFLKTRSLPKFEGGHKIELVTYSVI